MKYKKLHNIFEKKESKETPENIIIRFCPICKKFVVHTYHGFLGHNYREICTKCGNYSYVEEE